MIFIKLTSDSDGHPLYLNMSHIACLHPREEGVGYTTLCEVGDSGDCWDVQETPEEIMELIKQAK